MCVCVGVGIIVWARRGECRWGSFDCSRQGRSEWVGEVESVSLTFQLILEALIMHVECAIDNAHRFYSVEA